MSTLVSAADFARVQKRITAFQNASLHAGPAALASPSGRGLESAAMILEAEAGRAGFLKILHPEMRPYLDIDTGFAAARHAGDLGVSPKVLWAAPDEAAILFERVLPPWREAQMKDFLKPAFCENLMSALATLHQATPNLARFDAFAALDGLIETARTKNLSLPADIDWITALLGMAEPILLAAPLTLARNESSVSNLLIGPEDQVILVDFDRGGLNDPMYDLGAVLNEMTPFERVMRPHFERYCAAADLAPEDHLFARARLWAIVDDLLQALQSLIGGQTSARSALEWQKFGEWRLMRARLALHHPNFEENVRLAAGGL